MSDNENPPRCPECKGCLPADGIPRQCPCRCACPASIRAGFGVKPATGLVNLLYGTSNADNHANDDVPTTLAEQVAALMPFIAPASHPILHGIRKWMNIRANTIMQLVGERIVTGHAEHGANLFTMSDADLTRNIAEELADAIIYRAEQLRREAAS